MDCKIYLSGAMSGLTLERQLEWRNRIEDAINYGDYDYNKKPIFFSPPLFYSPLSEEYDEMNEQEKIQYEREAMFYDIHNLKDSDVMIVSLDNVNSSIGTCMEIALAKEWGIPIIGFYKDPKDFNNYLHPWVEFSLNKKCQSMNEVVEYVTLFYL